MTKSVYEKHDTAFKGIAAYAIANKDMSNVGIINIKGRQVFVQYYGHSMVNVTMRGSGYNYIRAGVFSAGKKGLEAFEKRAKENDGIYSEEELKFWQAISGEGETNKPLYELVKAGFYIFQAI